MPAASVKSNVGVVAVTGASARATSNRGSRRGEDRAQVRAAGALQLEPVLLVRGDGLLVRQDLLRRELLEMEAREEAQRSRGSAPFVGV